MQTTQTTPDVSLTHEPNETEADSKTVEQSDDEILRIAKDRFKLAQEAYTDIEREALDDLKFSSGEQWDPQDLKLRKEDNRPSLTINRIPQFVRQVANDIRQNRPAVKISPVDDKADVDTAKILQGMIRHIEYSSNADTAYDIASDSATRCGYGYYRLVTEFCDPMAFTQEIRIKPIHDRFAVKYDPASRELDGSDANWAFVEEQMPLDDFKAQFPHSKVSTEREFSSFEKEMGDWADKSSVRVTEYFYKEYHQATICLLGDGSVVEESKLIEGQQVVDKRETQLASVKWAKLNGCEILEKRDWAGIYIPIIPVYGEQLIIEGKKILSGVVRHAKDSQRMYNYFASCEAEAVALAPKAPYIAAAGQLEGFEDDWRLANRKSFSVLQYNAKVGTMQLPPPQRNAYEPAVQAMNGGRMLAGDDMKATTGIYDAGLGAQANEKSGIAIQRRANQSQTSNFHIVDNLSKSIRYGGRQMVDLIPKVYDTPQATRILAEDNTEKVVRINEMFQKENGEVVHYDLGVGKYDVTVSVGPSYETKRQEAAASMIDFSRSMPQQAGAIADLIVKNMDWQGADEIAKRLKKTLPPNLQDDDQQGPQAIPQQAQAQMQQQAQMISQLSKELEARTQQMNEKTLEYEHKERIVAMQLETQSAIELAKLQSKEATELLGHQIAEMHAVAARHSELLQSQNAPQQDAGPQGQSPQEMQPQQQPTGGLPPASMEQP